ncbi:uncharacterized protein LOC127835509 [Dreissena polymorpha]|uniref:uncharacterized protein LOC127835509 n=1 Tax=Dreissena polymorpha TaxID=45954 RepID=UPI002264A2D7|nr:uncharacterized protein LOC127835509 [Dreissena polymorpha]
MANFQDVFTSTEYRNWMKCHFAQSLAKDVLTDVVEAEIESFRIQILHHAQVTTLQPHGTVCNKCMTPNVIKCPTKTVCTTKHRGCKFHNSVALSNRRCPTNGMCDSLCKAIIDNHRFKGPSWKNTDATQWCTIAWSIAKCYMPPDGYENVNTAHDTDFNGIVNIIINCIKFQKYFKDDLSKSANICTKVRDKCKTLRHSPTMTMADDDMGHFIDTLVGILNDSVYVNNHSKFTETIQKLRKLKTDALGVSATDMNRTLEDALLNLTTMVKSCSDIKLEDRDSLKLQHMLNVADSLHHLTGDVRTRIEHALSGEKNETASSNKTIGAVAASVAGIAGVAGITAASFSVGGAGPASMGAGIAAATFASTAGSTLAFGLALLGAVAAPVVPITLASLYRQQTVEETDVILVSLTIRFCVFFLLVVQNEVHYS